jgi:hypothetical protein
MTPSPRQQRFFGAREEAEPHRSSPLSKQTGKNLSRHTRRDCGDLTIHPVDRATGLHVMFACCVEASQRTVIALLETCQITATTRG